MDRPSLTFVALAACSGARPQQQLSGVAPEPAIHTATCITRSSEEYPPSADSVAISSDAVTACFGVEPGRSCWHLDLATKVFAPAPVMPPTARQRAKAELHAGTIELCGPGGAPCRSVANPGRAPDPQWVGVSDDLATIAIPDDDTLRIYDAASAKLRATIHGWPNSPMAGDHFAYPPTFATPDRMIVWYAWSPVSEQGRIFDMAGHQLAIVGTDFMSLDPDSHAWRVHGTEWAIKSESNEILTVDVNDPRATSMYEISALLAVPRPPPDSDTHALDVLAVAGTAQRLVIVTGENPVTIGILDRATKRIEKLEPPRCPPR